MKYFYFIQYLYNLTHFIQNSFEVLYSLLKTATNKTAGIVSSQSKYKLENVSIMKWDLLQTKLELLRYFIKKEQNSPLKQIPINKTAVMGPDLAISMYWEKLYALLNTRLYESEGSWKYHNTVKWVCYPSISSTLHSRMLAAGTYLSLYTSSWWTPTSQFILF